jgi:hypothetical protein
MEERDRQWAEKERGLAKSERDLRDARKNNVQIDMSSEDEEVPIISGGEFSSSASPKRSGASGRVKVRGGEIYVEQRQVVNGNIREISRRTLPLW